MAKGKKEENLTIEEKLEQALLPREEWPYEVPENWCWVRVDSVVELFRGVSYKKEDAHEERKNGDCLILRGGNIEEGYLNYDADCVYVSKKYVKDYQLVRKYDVVIVGSTGSKKVIGRAGVCSETNKDVAFGAFLMLIRPKKQIIPLFVDYYFLTDIYRNRIKQLSNGVNINNIKTGNYSGHPTQI